jgi:lariat debranching enzyme
MPAPLAGSDKPVLAYDPEWLAITRAFHPYLSTTRVQGTFPDEVRARAMVAQELEWVAGNVMSSGDGGGVKRVEECQVFARTALGPGEEVNERLQRRQSVIVVSDDG